MEPTVRKVLSGAVGGPGVNLLVSIDDGFMALGFANATPQISHELI
jgi:hypothetical protein